MLMSPVFCGTYAGKTDIMFALVQQLHPEQMTNLPNITFHSITLTRSCLWSSVLPENGYKEVPFREQSSVVTIFAVGWIMTISTSCH